MKISITFALLFVVPVASAHARDMMLTIYDDGISCPENCDAHVVMNNADNGTRYAHSPNSSRTLPKKCVEGGLCVICFSEADESCMTVTYRGSGPKAGRFDFTPSFYRQYCSRADVPKELLDECKSLDRAAERLGYAKRINCLATPNDGACAAIIAKAQARKEADLPKWNECRTKGEEAYNAAQVDPKERRALNCNYSDLYLGKNGKWRILLPAACRPGTYVDQFGLDCCSSDIRFDAANHPECYGFFSARY